MDIINIPPKQDLENKWLKLQHKMSENGIDACLIYSNVNLYYLTGEIFNGYLYLAVDSSPICFITRETPLRKDLPFIVIRKPEEIPSLLIAKGLSFPKKIMFEGDQITYNEYIRLKNIFNNAETTADANIILRNIRMIKTDWEIEQLRLSTKKHTEVYELIPSCYEPGISDIKFQANIERLARKHGSIGIYRVFGTKMELHMGSILAGSNAEIPSPYDFALGGNGIHPSIPFGANGTTLKEGISVMVDVAGNYTAYVSDMTRTYSIGKLPDTAYKVHQISREIQDEIVQIAKPGVSCAELYELSVKIVQKAKLTDCFMGTKLQAKFVGHGLGIEVNEPPVLTGKSKEVLAENVTFALEPKFILPEIGAVGIENTFLVKRNGLEKLTLCSEDIINLEQ